MKLGEPDIKIAGLSLWILGRQFQDAQDYWDGNWLNVVATAEAVGARIEVQGAILRTDEIAVWADDIQNIQQNLAGQAHLDCIEPELDVLIECSRTGQLKVTVRITPDHLRQSHMIEYDADQSYLGELLRGCRKVLRDYPKRDQNTEVVP